MVESEKPVEGQEQIKDGDQDPGNKPPADIKNKDAEDESLVKYKKQLLGDGASSQIFCKL